MMGVPESLWQGDRGNPEESAGSGRPFALVELLRIRWRKRWSRSNAMLVFPQL